MNFWELLFKYHLCKSKNDINFLEWQFSCYVCVRDSYPTEPKMVLGFTWRHMKQNLKLAWVAGNARSLKGPWVILLDCPPVIFLFWVYARDPFVSKHRLVDWMTKYKCLANAPDLFIDFAIIKRGCNYFPNFGPFSINIYYIKLRTPTL